MKQTITQEDGMGCGVACVAFIANRTYEEVVKIMGRQKARTIGFHLKDVVNALGQYGFRYTFKHVKPKTKSLIYDDGAVVFIRRSLRYPYGHYLTRYHGLWFDPWINLVTNPDLINAKSGYRQRLPGEAQWMALPIVSRLDEGPTE